MTGRPSTYSDEVAEAILARMSEGEFVQDICREDGMPSVQTLWRWREARPAFREAYARARLQQAQAVAENGFLRAWNAKDAQLDRLAFDAAKWMAAKLDPRNYSERVQNEHSGAEGGPLVVELVKFAPDTTA